MGDTEESCESRQKNELEVLQAIYSDDLKDLRTKAAWNKWTPLNLSLTLRPQQGSSGTKESYVQVDLHVICLNSYPNSVPQIYLENSKGLSNMLIENLNEELREKALALVGEEMIFQLAQHVEEFLHRHNKPAMKSFYDEMLQQQKEKQRLDLEQQRLEQDRQRQNVYKEVQERLEILKFEEKLWRERRTSENSTEEEFGVNRRHSNSNRKRNDSLSENNEDVNCTIHKGTVIIEFGNRKIRRGQCLKHISENEVIFSGIDLATGDLVTLCQWEFNVKSTEISQVQRILSSIEQEINYLTKLKHINLINYLGIRHEIQNNSVVVHLLKEFVFGSSCSSLFIDQNIKIDIIFLKYIAKGILSALEYLHRNNVVHRDLGESCVYISDKGIIKVSDYSIHRRLRDLFLSSHGNYSKKCDIYMFGKLIFSFLSGNYKSDKEIDIPDTLQPDLYEFLTRCLVQDEKERLTAAQLLNEPFFQKRHIHFLPVEEPHEVAPERNISPVFTQNLLALAQSQAGSKSRINNEFEFLQDLGKGAFGDVLKVRNKLDGGYYAIKRIKLNPRDKALSKKIVREVMLLSRLNHENVVRYYNSWIENTTIKEPIDENSEVSTETTSNSTEDGKIARHQVIRKDEFTINDNIEELAPPISNVEVSVTYDSKSQTPYIASSDDESSDDGEAWANVYSEDSDSDGIEFERSSASTSKESESKDINETESTVELKEMVTQIEYMYIQMEFCEKSTLRTAIDENLYLDESRVWRLFREIIEGLAHIHQQGMIHRDLKPVNIFLDSFDHVKIGDFGLATTIARRSRRCESAMSKSTTESLKEDAGDESKTGQVGTALYVAPEVNLGLKTRYNQKVDIYSLGVIFFEMCYKPLATAMERIKILTNLREKEVTFPEDFRTKKNEKKQFLVRWLLNYDISQRPTSQELLQSEHLPQPVLEEVELQDFVRHTLSNPQSKGYKYLIASCFKQLVTPAQDITYDKDPSASVNVKPWHVYEFVKKTCQRIFEQHGGQNLGTSLLMPKSKFYDGVDSCVKLMTHFGNIVTLPHDLRVPFARYVAWNDITVLRRYSIERVFREKKVFGFVPRELYECAFDIVNPNPGNLMTDAETLYIAYEIINELPGIKNKKFLIRLNHTSLLQAILLHFGIKDNQEDIFQIATDIKENKVPKTQMQQFLITRGLSDNMISQFQFFFNSEFEISKASNQFQGIIKKKTGEASVLAKTALQELKLIAQNAEAYGVTFDIVVAAGLTYNVQQFSGMICQFVCESKKKHNHGNKHDVVAAGGRYDSMISHYRNMMEQATMLGKGIQQSAVGISVSLDRLVQAVQKEQNDEFENLDVIVCSMGSKHLIREKTKILRDLWGAGIKASLIEATDSDEIQEQLNDLKVMHAIILKETDHGSVRVRSRYRDSKDRNKYQEKQYPTSDLIENILKIIKSSNENKQKVLKLSSENNTENIENTVVGLSRSESKSSNFSTERSTQEPIIDISFVTLEKISSNARKRYENQIRTQFSNSLSKRLIGFVAVLGLNIESCVIRTITAFLDLETDQRFVKSVNLIIGKHQKHKNLLNEIFDEICEQKKKKTNPTIVLYSLSDSFFNIIV